MAENKDTVTHVVATKDGPVTITRPKGKGHHRGVAVVLDTDEVVREQVGGFANFLREYAVVGLAIGFIVGQQANAVVKALVDSFVNPWLQVLFGTELNHRVSTLHHGTSPVKVPWGVFVYTLMEFFFVVVTIYILVKIFQLNRLKKEAKK